MRAVVGVLYWFLVRFLTLNTLHVSAAEIRLWFGLPVFFSGSSADAPHPFVRGTGKNPTPET